VKATRRHTFVGRIVLAIGAKIAKRKARENRGKLGAAAVVGAALVGGAMAARTASD